MERSHRVKVPSSSINARPRVMSKAGTKKFRGERLREDRRKQRKASHPRPAKNNGTMMKLAKVPAGQIP
jgi:hypothetical protein